MIRFKETMLLIYITFSSKNEAQKIGRILLKKRLITCFNIWPIESVYWWNAKIVKDKEIAMLAKTKETNFKKIEKEVKRHHSYKIPLIASFKIEKINKEYLTWMKNIITNQTRIHPNHH